MVAVLERVALNRLQQHWQNVFNKEKRSFPFRLGLHLLS